MNGVAEASIFMPTRRTNAQVSASGAVGPMMKASLFSAVALQPSDVALQGSFTDIPSLLKLVLAIHQGSDLLPSLDAFGLLLAFICQVGLFLGLRTIVHPLIAPELLPHRWSAPWWSFSRAGNPESLLRGSCGFTNGMTTY